MPVLYFLGAVAALIGGYMVYSRVIERIFGADFNRPTPASTMADGVDYIKMPPWKIFLIQLLNIAGVGPVFGPILGALYGPSALLWIVLGSIFAGGVHDYFSGMLSTRYQGKSIPDVVGYTLGNTFKQFMRVFSLVLLLLVGVVFVTAPAGLIGKLTMASPDALAAMQGQTLGLWDSIVYNLTNGTTDTYVFIIFAYYFLATILPIDIIIGKLYPLFAVVLLIMAFGVAGGLIVEGYGFYNWAEWTNQHPKGLPLWPLMFVTIACGALSGFHATQSPLMARCVPDERCGRPIFYGSMIAEGIIALIWATAGMTFYQSPEALAAAGNPSQVVTQVCMTLLGSVGGVLAILGVVVLPITSGDTAFRAARLLVADFTSVSQKSIMPRLVIALPLFAVGIYLSYIDFNIIWRYFGWSNQTLATIVLWSAGAYIARRGMPHWVATIPATFMTAVVFAYIANEKIGFSLSYEVSVCLGVAAALISLALFMANLKKFRTGIPLELPATA